MRAIHAETLRGRTDHHPSGALDRRGRTDGRLRIGRNGGNGSREKEHGQNAGKRESHYLSGTAGRRFKV